MYSKNTNLPETSALEVPCDPLAEAMRQSGHHWRQTLNASLESVGLTLLQWSVLELVNETPGMSQTELAKAVGIEGPSLVRVLDGLEGQGWLFRSPDREDRRVKRVFLDKDCGVRLEVAVLATRQVHEKAVSLMNEEDRVELLRLVRLLIDGLS